MRTTRKFAVLFLEKEQTPKVAMAKIERENNLIIWPGLHLIDLTYKTYNSFILQKKHIFPLSFKRFIGFFLLADVLHRSNPNELHGLGHLLIIQKLGDLIFLQTDFKRYEKTNLDHLLYCYSYCSSYGHGIKN